MPRMLLVDDHPALQRGLQELFSAEFPLLQIELANSEASALAALNTGHWDIAVIDINLPGEGGLNLIRTIKERRPLVRLLVYTMHSEQQFGIRALRCGADGYLTKDAAPEELFRAIRLLLSGRRYVSPYLADQLAAVVAGDHIDEKHQALSGREYEVFQALISGLSLSETAARLKLNVKTVSTYRARLLEKLEVKNQSDLIRYALRHGLISE
jgi:two-component system, NarL family, invasion response regulator UvrY